MNYSLTGEEPPGLSKSLQLHCNGMFHAVHLGAGTSEDAPATKRIVFAHVKQSSVALRRRGNCPFAVSIERRLAKCPMDDATSRIPIKPFAWYCATARGASESHTVRLRHSGLGNTVALPVPVVGIQSKFFV